MNILSRELLNTIGKYMNSTAWVLYPPVGKRTARQRFVYRAAALFDLVSRYKSGNCVAERVEKSFHDLMQSCPLPDGVENWNFQPQPEHFFIHLTLRRLEGAPLPLPLETFTPK